jgi:hypothetical protein
VISDDSRVSRRHSPSRSLSVAFVVGFTLLWSGCLQLNLDLFVNDDGSGRVTYSVAVAASVIADLEDFDEGTLPAVEIGADDSVPPGDDEVIDEFRNDMRETVMLMSEPALPNDARVEAIDEQDTVGLTLTLDFPAVDDVTESISDATATVMDEVSRRLSADLRDSTGIDVPLTWTLETAFPSVAVHRDAIGWTVEVDSEELIRELITTDFDLLTSEDRAFAERVARDTTFVMRLRLPADVVEHNATRVEGDTLVWEVPLELYGEMPVLTASSVPGASGDSDSRNSTIAIVVGAVALIAVLVVAVLIAWRRGSSPAAPPAA